MLLAGEALAATPGYYDGNELCEKCTSSNAFDYGVCVGYVQVVSAYIDFDRVRQGMPQCLPSTTTAQQIFDEVVQYLQQQPQRRTDPALVLVLAAVSQAWNCK